MKKIRCAIYTRKSSEEGLEQDFNSLDAQREACAAYILSQASEGWSLLPEFYDDGGLSGGSLARPALQRLLSDIAAGRVDVIVVYKVDRLTRSLFDFAKLVETFEKAGTSFVSVTQSFNTTTSMGRLTLNMLLSFAQFEREVTAERIRDKIAASKAKGMWMGGTPPLGYEPKGRSLEIVEEHAEIVRHIYRRYLDLGNVRLLFGELMKQRIVIPRRTFSTGRPLGGGRFTRGQIYKLLSNPLYVGEIHHRGQIYAGQHSAIIDRGTWNEVQERLNLNLRGERRSRAANASPLAGIVVDEAGEPLIPVHACKGKVRYRYYVSRALQHGELDEPGKGMRIPARELETHVSVLVAKLFDDPVILAARLQVAGSDIATMIARSGALAAELRTSGRRLPEFVSQVRIFADRLEVDVSGKAVTFALDVMGPVSSPVLELTAGVQLRRSGGVIRLVHQNGRSSAAHRPNPALIGLVAKANCWWRQLAEGQLDVTELACREDLTASYVTRVVRLAFLSPAVVDAILEGRQRADLTCTDLIIRGDLPALWPAQVEQLI